MNTVLLRTGGSFVFALLFSSVVLTSQSLAGSAPTCGVAQFPPAFDLSDNDPGNSSATYSYAPGADLGFGDSRPDAIVVSFQGSAYGVTGSYVLNAAPNDNLSTCEVCVLVYADMDAGNTPSQYYFQREGILTITEAPGPTAQIHLSIPDIVVEQVSINSSTFQSTPIPGGACYRQDTSTSTCTGAAFPSVYARQNDDPSNSSAQYAQATGKDMGFGGPGPDAVVISFDGAAYSALGTYSLGSPPNDTLGTCETCVLVYGDIDNQGTPTRYFFQREGTLTVLDPPGPSNQVQVTLPDIVVEEVTIDSQSGVATPLPGGSCHRPNDNILADGFEGFF
ncbi:MAG: hypothetical protein R3F12_05695 [Lysobacteraceae bacterium]